MKYIWRELSRFGDVGARDVGGTRPVAIETKLYAKSARTSLCAEDTEANPQTVGLFVPSYDLDAHRGRRASAQGQGARARDGAGCRLGQDGMLAS